MAKKSQPTRQERLQGKLATHIRRAGKKAQKGCEPNDRSYDPEFQKRLRRIPPELFDALIHGDD